MKKSEQFFGKRVLRKGSPRPPAFRGATLDEMHTGRTLLEMLAVLAIIGVLSITALVGFTYAMNKHRANETIYDVMLRGTNVPMIDENYASKPSGYEFRFPDLPAGTYYPMTTKKDAGSSYYVEATGVTYRVCELILKMNPTDIDQIVVGNTVYQGDSDICGNTDGLALKFCFGEDGTICDGTGHGGSSGGNTSGGSGSGSSGGSGSDTEEECITSSDCDGRLVCIKDRCVERDSIEPAPCETNEECAGMQICNENKKCECIGTPTCGPCQKYDYDIYGCPSSCVDIKDCSCPSEPTCTECEEYVYDQNNCPISCQKKACISCSAEEVSVGEDACGCDICTSCPELDCTDPCTQENYETCRCETIEGCTCPEFKGCGPCEEETVDSNNCPICEPKSCTITCQDGETATGYDACNCPTGCGTPCSDSSSCGEGGCCKAGVCHSDCEPDDCCDEEGNCDPSCMCLTCDQAFNSSQCICTNGGCDEGEECTKSCSTDENGCVLGFSCSCILPPAAGCDLGQQTCFGSTPSEQWCCDAAQTCGDTYGECLPCSKTEIACGSGDNLWCCSNEHTCGTSNGECCAEGVCCDTTTNELVKNYVNGTGKAGYTCCSVKEDEGPNSGWKVAGAINGTCCSGWTNYSEVRYSIPDLTVIDTTTSSRSIRQNGGVYYCATDLQTQEWYNDSLNMENESVYVSDSQWCYIQNGRYEYCYTSKSGNPSVTSAYSEQYCSYPNCP